MSPEKFSDETSKKLKESEGGIGLVLEKASMYSVKIDRDEERWTSVIE